jgi:aryl-alcohol dehydrogenase-like predicted oxidoreductase
MKYRSLGRTGLNVSEIGYGAWGIGGRTAGETSYGETDDKVSRAALERALALGINFFDTAGAYGDGRSERLIGEVLGSARAQVVIATKAGIERFGDTPDYAPDRLRRSLEQSLERLKTDHIDLLQLHDPPNDLFQASPEIHAALEKFRSERLIRAFGVSAKSPADALAMLRTHSIPVMQVNLNMLDVRAVETGLLAIAREKGVGIIARTPLCFGFLTGVPADHEFEPGDHRRSWPRRQLELWREGTRRTQAIVASPGDSASQTALRFCLSFPEVSTVIPGILTDAEANENARASELGPLDASARDRIVEFSLQNSFFAGG